MRRIGLGPVEADWIRFSSGSEPRTHQLILSIPEPTTVLLLATGFAALAWRVRRG